jgi:hypothetical protein
VQVMQAEDPPAGGDEVPLQRDRACQDFMDFIEF